MAGMNNMIQGASYGKYGGSLKSLATGGYAQDPPKYVNDPPKYAKETPAYTGKPTGYLEGFGVNPDTFFNLPFDVSPRWKDTPPERKITGEMTADFQAAYNRVIPNTTGVKASGNKKQPAKREQLEVFDLQPHSRTVPNKLGTPEELAKAMLAKSIPNSQALLKQDEENFTAKKEAENNKSAENIMHPLRYAPLFGSAADVAGSFLMKPERINPATFQIQNADRIDEMNIDPMMAAIDRSESGNRKMMSENTSNQNALLAGLVGLNTSSSGVRSETAMKKQA
jgi:hypothetical protein